MDAGLEFGVERFHHRTVLGDARQAGEGGGSDPDAEMALATGARAGMPSMFLALVQHFKMAWREFERKFFNNGVANGHMDTGSV